MGPLLWLILMVVLIIIEIITLGITTIWFAVGSLVAFLVSLFFQNPILESSVFVIVSFIMLFITKPIVVKHFNLKKEKTNYMSIIGLRGSVVIKIDNIKDQGKVKVNNQEWIARSYNNEIIEENSIVVIKDISGVKLIVEKLKEEV